MKIKAQATLYTSGDVDLFLKSYRTMDPDRLAQSLIYYKPDAGIDGWSKVGTAEVELTISADGEMREEAIAQLKEEQEKLRAETEYKLNRIQERINSLLCLEHTLIVEE